MKNCFYVCSIFVFSIFIASCKPSDMKKLHDLLRKDLTKPKRVISINSIVRYPKAKDLEKEIDTFTGRKIWINTNYLIHSKDILDIELIPRDTEKAFYDLKVSLSEHAKLVWMSVSASFKNKKIAFLIDGLFYRSFSPEQVVIKNGEETNYMIIEGPFDKYTAEELKKYAKTNCEYFNQD